eukprot:5797161-Amphidinium_carterae.1
MSEGKCSSKCNLYSLALWPSAVSTWSCGEMPDELRHLTSSATLLRVGEEATTSAMCVSFCPGT